MEFIQQKSIGYEYFEGDIDKMITIVQTYTREHAHDLIEPAQEPTPAVQPDLVAIVLLEGIERYVVAHEDRLLSQVVPVNKFLSGFRSWIMSEGYATSSPSDILTEVLVEEYNVTITRRIDEETSKRTLMLEFPSTIEEMRAVKIKAPFRYKCERCGYRTNKRSSFINHFNRLVECVAVYDMISLDELRDRFPKIVLTKEFACMLCDKKYEHASGLYRHKKEHDYDTFPVVCSSEILST